ncbi:MAG: hypothetical protein ACI8PZ_004778 [Myxococcota bacterium]|jgi:hypothetical protein
MKPCSWLTILRSAALAALAAIALFAAIPASASSTDCSVVEAMAASDRSLDETLAVVVKLVVSGAASGQSACIAAAGATADQIVAVGVLESKGVSCAT